MEEKEITAGEGFEIIQSMINVTRNKLADDGFYFIFWGWLVTISALTHYAGIYLKITNIDLIWAFSLPAGGLVSVIYSRMEHKEKKVRTHIDSYLGHLWTAILIAIFLVLIFMGMNGYRNTYFFLMVLYGIGSLVTGGLLNFRPLIVGSVFSFAFAALSVFVRDIDLFLCISGSLVCSHIVPGYILRSRYRSQNV